jgi:hypothetical protein
VSTGSKKVDFTKVYGKWTESTNLIQGSAIVVHV